MSLNRLSSLTNPTDYNYLTHRIESAESKKQNKKQHDKLHHFFENQPQHKKTIASAAPSDNTLLIDEPFNHSDTLEQIKTELKKVIDQTDYNIFLRSFKPKRDALRDLLEHIQQAEGGTKNLGVVIDTWCHKESCYGKYVLKNDEPTLVLYKNHEILTHHRHFLFGKKRDTMQTTSEEFVSQLLHKHDGLVIR